MPDKDLIRLGERARKLRKEHNMSQQSLSDKSGLAVRTISRIERGLMNPSVEVLLSLTSGLGTSIELLFARPAEEDDADIHELVRLYQTCPEQKRHLIMSIIRTLVHELKNDASDCVCGK